MAIYQTNVFVCEKCDRIQSKTTKVSLYDSWLVNPPEDEDWDYTLINGKEVLICPDCLFKELSDKNLQKTPLKEK